MQQIRVLGTRIDSLSMNQSIEHIKQVLAGSEKIRIVTANPEIVYKAEQNKKLQDIINTAGLILPDGVGILWAARQLGYSLPERVTGVDLTLRILEEGNRQGWRIFLLGGRPGVAEKAVIRQSKRFPRIVFGCHHGYFTEQEEPALIRRIVRFAPDILLIGLGAPKQEYWNAANPGLAGVSIGVGGTIDVLAGQVKRAPQFFSDHNLEWLYRLVTQPSRLRRQLILPRYVLRILQEKKQKEKHK